MNPSDFKVGQTVILSGDERHLSGIKAVVTKIGRKYVTVQEGGWERQFYLDKYRNAFVEKVNWGLPLELFPTEESYQIEVERERIFRRLHTIFDYSHKNDLSYEQLKQIETIIGNKYGSE